MKLFRKIFFIFLGCIPGFINANELPVIKSEGMHLTLKLVAQDFDIPWGMDFISDRKIIVTERDGDIYLLNLENKKRAGLTGVPQVFADGQGGMLDVKVSPGFRNDGWIYFTYSKEVSDGEGATVLARARLNSTQTGFIGWEELLVTDSATDTGYHFGSRIAFDQNGHVYFGIGDRGIRENSQDLTNHAGSIIRLKLDGKVPGDNPFVNDNNVLDEIWSYGHRNPQGLVYDNKHNRLWEIEHGPRGGDEINLVEPGKNYGWPVISYGKEYWGPIAVGESTHKEGMEQPVKYYVPSIAPGSLAFYQGERYPGWKYNLFSGALKLRHLNRVVINEKGMATKEERLFSELDERIRSIAISPDGYLYLGTDSGDIYKVTYFKK